MSTIRTTCVDCGDIDAAIEEISLGLVSGGRAGQYPARIGTYVQLGLRLMASSELAMLQRASLVSQGPVAHIAGSDRLLDVWCPVGSCRSVRPGSK
jgi:hypothetical protein